MGDLLGETNMHHEVDCLIRMIKAAMENLSSDENQDFIDKLRDLLISE